MRWRRVVALVVAAIVPLVSVSPSAADPSQVDTWYLDSLAASDTTDLTAGEDITVAVIDTGVTSGHPELGERVDEGATVTPDGVESGGDTDPDGHGTAMAGLIAGDSGVAPEARVLPVRVSRDSDGTLDERLVYRGVKWAIDQGATVINMSLAGQPTGDATWKSRMLDYAIANDAVLIAAVGNRGDDLSGVGEPAAIPGVVAVSGLGKDGRLWAGSETGESVVLAAPAEDLPHLTPGGDMELASGTSAAAALVSGVAALVQSRYPTASAGDVVSRLIQTTDEAGPQGRDKKYGYGAVNARAALTAAVAPGKNSRYFPLDLPGQGAGEQHEPDPVGSWWTIAGAVIAAAVFASLWLTHRRRR